MRFKVAKQDLDAALQVVTPSMSSSGDDITSHYVFRRTGTKKDGYGITLVTCSERMFSSCPLKAEIVDEGTKGSFTIEGKRLKQWLNSVPDAVLSFALDEEESEVIARAPKGKQTFQSLQPDSRFVWDKEIKAAKITATVSAERLASALKHSRLFVSVKGTDSPELCVSEVLNGILYSTDRKVATLIRLEGLEESNLRIHGKDASGFLAFLNTFNETDVEVLEHDRVLILRRGDGAVFGEARFQATFPGINVNIDDDDQHQWVLSKEEITNVIGFLASGADREDNRLRFTPSDDEGVIELSMLTVSGKKTVLPIQVVKHEQTDKFPEIPPEGYALDHFCLTKVLSVLKGDGVEFGINVVGDRGYVRFLDEPNGDRYVTILAWLQ